MRQLHLGKLKHQLDARCCLNIQRDRALMMRLGWTERLGSEVEDAFEILDSTIKFESLSFFRPLRDHFFNEIYGMR